MMTGFGTVSVGRALCVNSLLLAILLTGAAWAADPAPPALRLPKSVRPIHGTLDLTIVPEQESFTGSAVYDIEILEPVTVIWLNASDLTISSATVSVAGKERAARIIMAAADFAGLAFDSTLSAGKARMHIEYTGKLDPVSTHGVFRQREGDDWYVYTQFEATDARRGFPCFDEPAYKIRWQLTLRVPSTDLAVSNTPLTAPESSAGDMKIFKFAETPPLPSYLIAFGVGPFEFVDAGRAGKNNVPLRIVTPKGQGAMARYAAEVTPKILNLCEEYFGIPYPYEKLDSLAIPQTVGFGAMENAGLITYRIPSILARPADESIQFRRGYAYVAAHEIAHQWFGDLVTMGWWDDIWLNESFATWLSAKIIERLRPDWGTALDRVSNRYRTMGLDSLATARRIRQPIETKNDIDNAFDGISYGKGAAVLAMFESWMGEVEFRRGVRRYITAHSNGNATATDFLKALDAEAGGSIGPAFSTYLDQAGIPVVTAELRCGDEGGFFLALSQKRYLPRGSEGSATQKWSVPLRVAYSSGGKTFDESFLMTTQSLELPLTSATTCPDWVLVNDTASGYYRVQYKGDLLDRLLTSGRGPSLTAAQQISLLSDLAAAVEAGEQPIARALTAATTFAQSPVRQVVECSADIVQMLRQDMVPDALRPNHARFIMTMYGQKATSLGFARTPDEDEDTMMLRRTLLWLAGGEADDPATIEEAGKLARKWISDRTAIDPDMVGTVLSMAARAGNKELFALFRAEAAKTKDRRERDRLLSALGHFRDPALLQSALSILLATDFDLRDSITILWSALQERDSRTAAWAFLTQNVDAIAARMPRDYPTRMMWAGASFCDMTHRAEVEALFKERSQSYPGGPRVLAQVLEQISLCNALREAEAAGVGAFLQQY